jgi:hypothetical protein
LRGAHPRRDLGLGQPSRLPLSGQLNDQAAPLAGHPAQRHLAESGQPR